ncbi:putative E3 ubiquitin-protein ligase makorin-1 [Rhynchophorus ferrugineus]|uniref:putative E3 ubiquitin-protein ligase makorin-1 n=1 Tax=Rhynchophorus ferrugineus TaxID=354439 RepID=UPI003FCE78FB
MDIAAGCSRPGTSEDKKICNYYLRGWCKFGPRCRFHHVRPKTKTGGKTRKAASTSQSKYNKQYDAETREALELVRKAQSANKSCGICFDTVLEKEITREQLFGILPNCNHCYCFYCIKTWRQSKEFDFTVAKSCPECRISSDYVYPSRFWYDSKEEKEAFINNEKARIQRLHCKYFRRGNGRCPFGNTCLYLHALPDGTKKDVGPPKPRRKRPSTANQDIFFWMNGDSNDDILDLLGLELATQRLLSDINALRIYNSDDDYIYDGDEEYVDDDYVSLVDIPFLI